MQQSGSNRGPWGHEPAHAVVPAKAGTQYTQDWIPAFAGMTRSETAVYRPAHWEPVEG